MVRRLAERVGAEQITCLARATSDTAPLEALSVRIVTCDVTDTDALTACLGPDTVYLDMTHPKYYDRSLPAVAAAGVERAYYVTTTGIFSQFHRCSDIYKRGEQAIRDCGFVYTILRPSMIYGSLRDRNMNRLIWFLNRYPVFPLFGDGSNLMQPVFVEDLAKGIVAAVDNSITGNKDYNLAGPEPIRYADMIDTVTAKLGRKVRKLRINASAAQLAVRAVQWVPGFPINDEQVLRMREDKAFDISDAATDLGYSPRSFEEGISLEIELMREAGLI